MLGLCQTPTNSSCLFLMIRENAPFFAFHSNDCPGKTIILTHRWYHFAFVYDYPLQTQYIYLNGRIECTHESSHPFIASEGALTIGAITDSNRPTPNLFWTGYIDAVSCISEAKSAAEILLDATLVAHYSFDSSTDYHLDVGPNQMHGVSDRVRIAKSNGS